MNGYESGLLFHLKPSIFNKFGFVIKYKYSVFYDVKRLYYRSYGQNRLQIIEKYITQN